MPKVSINSDRLWATLMETARFGGSEDGGVRRLALSEEDRQVRDWLKEECLKLGCEVTVDGMGNMFAVLPGQSNDALPVAMGSHLDTQPTGGKFDGILGVLAGLEVMRTVREQNITLHRPLALVNWTNEEGARFSPAMIASGAHAGVFPVETVLATPDASGVTFGEALDAIGYRGDRPVGEMQFDAMFELHIEQGPILEAEGRTIGVVDGVQGISWFDIEVSGLSAHAGTTPMALRRDAFCSAADFTLAVRALVLEENGFATFGEFSIANASRNVVPGHVRLTLDLRHPDDAARARVEERIAELCRHPRYAGTPIKVTRIWNSPAVHFDAGCVAAVATAADANGLSSRRMVSGAGHDAVYASKIAPTSMIFIPCKDGISHNPIESATQADCAAGTQVLFDAVIGRAVTREIGEEARP